MGVITPTTPTVLSPAPIPAVVLATANLGTRYTLDLRGKKGAYLYPRIGRRGATALTVSARILARPTLGDTIVHPTIAYDLASSIAAAASTTLSASNSIGDASIALTSATGFAAGDVLCLHSDDTSANRVEFVEISYLSGTTAFLREPLKLAHTSADRVTNQADCRRLWLPGQDVYAIRADNGASGQSLVFQCLGETDDSDTY